ncbi:MAG: signal peptide peptidase SppA [Vicinamibacterales bacterium]
MATRRGVRFVLVLIALAVFVSAACLALVSMVMTGGPAVANESTLVLRPGGDLAEVAPSDVLGQFIGGNETTVRGFVDNLEKARRDPRVTGVLLRPSTISSPYWGKLQELRDAVIRFRASGKPVVAFLEYGGEREYYLASAADAVYLLPTSPLDLTGVASYEMFLRGALDKLGAYPDFLHVGDYKTAINQFTEKGFTPTHREMSEALNRDAYDQLVHAIAEARKKTDAEVRGLFDQGPFTPQQAKDAGLVDDLAYEDELDDRAGNLGLGTDADYLEGTDYQRVSLASLGVRPRSRIAVLYIVGTIVSGKSTYDATSGELVGSDTVVDQIRRIRRDSDVKAIVLRIDSPGGSSVASDVIWRELTITREQQPARPIIASMSDLAASGGYYVALPAQTIVAQPGTLTGSIGVFMGKVAIGGTLEKLGVTTETVKSGKNADVYSPVSAFTPEQREKLGEYMQVFYSTFVEKVAASRRSTPDKIHAVAQGRVWTGAQARERGLVDELGGLDRAVAVAKMAANIPADEDVQLVAYPARRSFYETLTEQFGRGSMLSQLKTALAGNDISALATLSSPLRIFRRGEPLALMPFSVLK